MEKSTSWVGCIVTEKSDSGSESAGKAGAGKAGNQKPPPQFMRDQLRSPVTYNNTADLQVHYNVVFWGLMLSPTLAK